MVYICIRKTTNWASAADFWAQLPPQFKPSIDTWNQTFNIPYHLFRLRLREISRINLAAVKNAACVDWNDVPDGALVMPVDDDDWFAEDAGSAVEEAWHSKLEGLSWESSFLEVPVSLGHWLYLKKQRFLRTDPMWVCTTNNYAMRKSSVTEPLLRNHIQASGWFLTHPESIKRVDWRISLMNRTLGSRTSLGLKRPHETKAIKQRSLLKKYQRYRNLYSQPVSKELAWSRPYVAMMKDLMDELHPA